MKGCKKLKLGNQNMFDRWMASSSKLCAMNSSGTPFEIIREKITRLRLVAMYRMHTKEGKTLNFFQRSYLADKL